MSIWKTDRVLSVWLPGDDDASNENFIDLTVNNDAKESSYFKFISKYYDFSRHFVKLKHKHHNIVYF